MDNFNASRDALLHQIQTSDSFIKELTLYATSKLTFITPPLADQRKAFKALKPTLDPLSSQLDLVVKHLARLTQRLNENCSKILVTGDLNAGKSTLINRLLDLHNDLPILPTDQQPCTMGFCEVVCSSEANNEVSVRAFQSHNSAPSKSLSVTLAEMQSLASDPDSEYGWFQIDVPAHSNSLLSPRMGLGVSLIDSPGLNSDSIKTLALFAKQEDIDIVLFVVNACNHLTLSAREFLEEAGKEKAFVFTVVNRMDEIRDKEKCSKMILKQIGEVLPFTWQSHSELVHFISALHTREPGYSVAFEHLISELKKFVLEKRTLSKLAPAKRYLVNMIDDLVWLIAYNLQSFSEQYQVITAELKGSEAEWEMLQGSEERLMQALNEQTDRASSRVYEETKSGLHRFIQSIPALAQSVPWTGLLGLYKFKAAVQAAISTEAHHCLLQARKASIEAVTEGVWTLHHTAQTLLPEIYSKMPAPDTATLLMQADPIAYKDELQLSLVDALFATGASDTDGIIMSVLFMLFKRPRILSVAAGVVVSGIVTFKYLPLSVRLIGIGALVGGVAWYSLLGNEAAVRGRLCAQAEMHYLQGASLVQFYSRALECSCRKLLRIPCNDLMAKWHHWMSRCRGARNDRESQRRRYSSILEYLEGTRTSLVAFRRSIYLISI